MGKLNTLYRTATGLEKIDVEAIFSNMGDATLEEKIHMLGKLVWYIPGGIHSSKYDELKYLINQTLFGEELLADVNTDKIVNIKDINLIKQAIKAKSTDEKYDVNQDSEITEEDVAVAKMLSVSEKYGQVNDNTVVISPTENPVVLTKFKGLGLSTKNELTVGDLKSISSLTGNNYGYVCTFNTSSGKVTKYCGDEDLQLYWVNNTTSERINCTLKITLTDSGKAVYTCYNDDGDVIFESDNEDYADFFENNVPYMEATIDGVYYTEVLDVNEQTNFMPGFMWSNVTDMSFLTYMTGLTEIPMGCMAGCQATEIELPSNVTTIDSFAFTFCNNLTTFVCDSSLTTIGTEVFSECENLTTVSLNEGLTTINEDAFTGCPITDLTLPSTLTYIGDGAFEECNNLCAGSYLYIPASVEYIGERAFAYMHEVESIIFDDEFNGTIDDEVFLQAGKITYISLGNAKSIGRQAFVNFYNTEDEPKTYITINMSKSVETIEEGAFSVYDINTYTYAITLPISLTTIEGNAFKDLNLLGINYEGKKEQWNDINKTEGWYSQSLYEGRPYSYLTCVHCSNGDVEI